MKILLTKILESTDWFRPLDYSLGERYFDFVPLSGGECTRLTL